MKTQLTLVFMHLLQSQSLGSDTKEDQVTGILDQEMPPTFSKDELVELLQHDNYTQIIGWACADLIVVGKPQPDTIDLLSKEELEARFVGEMIIMAMCGNAPWKPDTDGRLVPFIFKAKKAVEKFRKSMLTQFDDKEILTVVRDIVMDLITEYRAVALDVLKK